MKNLFLALLSLTYIHFTQGQAASNYTISFENAVHHEAEVNVTFSGLQAEIAHFRMSRSSPGRYAIHEFAKNVYNVKVTDGQGKLLKATRPDPYSWIVSGHDGILNVSYTLFANHGDGTYSQVDESHAHLNMPATFMYAPELADKPYEVNFDIREDLEWKVATQLKNEGQNIYSAPDLQYFMDSPTELSNHSIRSFDVKGQEVKFVLHHEGNDEEFDKLFEKVKKVVLEQEAIYAELPEFDYGEYLFLACYMPQVDGDGMEHRNSTILTSTRPLGLPGFDRHLGTITHEFFHAWNVERFRPASLEPFDFTKANMSGELWFAEGFTSYYAGLVVCRTGEMSPAAYLKWLGGSFNYVWNSTGRDFFNPVEMSYQAPFVDAATSVDEVNSRNTFISYYNYGHKLGLALDLALREIDLNLDDYMKLVWEVHGKPFKPYTNEDLHQLLNTYAGVEFGDAFFGKYIFGSEMPNYERLFNNMGISMKTKNEQARFGAFIDNLVISQYPAFDSPAYAAHLTKNDKILEIDGQPMESDETFTELLKGYKPGDVINVVYERFGKRQETSLTLAANPNYELVLSENIGKEVNEAQLAKRSAWLSSRVNN